MYHWKIEMVMQDRIEEERLRIEMQKLSKKYSS
jgi:hypothetical protein